MDKFNRWQFDIFLIFFRKQVMQIVSIGDNKGSGNFEIWIGPADDDDVINEPSPPHKKNMYISPVTKTNDNWQFGSPISPFK